MNFKFLTTTEFEDEHDFVLEQDNGQTFESDGSRAQALVDVVEYIQRFLPHVSAADIYEGLHVFTPRDWYDAGVACEGFGT